MEHSGVEEYNKKQECIWLQHKETHLSTGYLWFSPHGTHERVQRRTQPQKKTLHQLVDTKHDGLSQNTS